MHRYKIKMREATLTELWNFVLSCFIAFDDNQVIWLAETVRGSQVEEYFVFVYDSL